MLDKTLDMNSPELLERYEAKYTIPQSMVEPISEYVQTYCHLDKHSKVEIDHCYQINSLYFDTPNHLFLQQRMDQSAHRFNMRIRTYGNKSSWPAFFEIKRKDVNVIRKLRAKIDGQKWLDKLQGLDQSDSSDRDCYQTCEDNRHYFILLAAAYGATPKVLTQYKRKAYVSDVDDYARVTFDKEMRYQVAEGYRLQPDDHKMVPLDHALRFDSGCNIVLELKCYTTHVPLWMVDLIRFFQLKRRSFSKYANGAMEVLGLWQYSRSDRMGGELEDNLLH